MKTLAAMLLAAAALGAQKPAPEELLEAVQRGEAAGVKRLLERGADPNAANPAGATPLMWAIPDLEKVKLLIAGGADVNARSSNLGRTPFLIAASYPGTAPLLRFLLSKGADPKARARNGDHALSLAARDADVEVVRFLVELGLEYNQGRGPLQATPLGIALSRRYRPTIDYLMERDAAVQKNISGAAYWLGPATIAALLDRGADVNARATAFGRTAVISAASADDDTLPTLRLLLEKGADPNLADSDGETALDWAMHRRDEARIALLKAHGAKPAPTPRDQTFPKPEGLADPRASLARAVARLQPAASVVFGKRGCISCHNQSLVAQVSAAARAKGVPVDERMAAQNLKETVAAYRPIAQEAMQGVITGGGELTIGYIAMALAAEKHPADSITAALTHIVAGRQLPDGSWPEAGSRPPMEYSTISRTAMAIRTVMLYPIPARGREIQSRLERARQWMLAARPASAEEHAMRIMALAWTRAPRRDLDAAIGAWLPRQYPDGGWAQLPHLETDAYATGLTLYALSQAGFSVTDPACRRGIAWLLRNQYADGSWFVRTRSFPVQPQMESGFPFGYHQWISAAATCWSSLAIAATL